MSIHDADLVRLLHQLDPADVILSPVQERRKHALRSALLAGPADQTRAWAGPAPQRSRPRRWWSIPIAAAIAGAVVIFQGPFGSSAAYASWTPVAHPVSPTVQAQAARACRHAAQQNLSQLADVPARIRPTLRTDTLRTVVAEQRGAFLFLDMYAADSSTFQCFFNADNPSRVTGSGGGLATPSTAPPRDLGTHGLQIDGGGTSQGPQGDYAFVEGRVGSQVTKVTIHIPGRTVRATLRDGHFAAWWPGPAPTTATLDLTLDNGRTLTHHKPV